MVDGHQSVQVHNETPQPFGHHKGVSWCVSNVWVGLSKQSSVTNLVVLLPQQVWVGQNTLSGNPPWGNPRNHHTAQGHQYCMDHTQREAQTVKEIILTSMPANLTERCLTVFQVHHPLTFEPRLSLSLTSYHRLLITTLLSCSQSLLTCYHIPSCGLIPRPSNPSCHLHIPCCLTLQQLATIQVFFSYSNPHVSTTNPVPHHTHIPSWFWVCHRYK